MRSVQTYDRFPLSSVKPLENLQGYRRHCLTQTGAVLEKGSFPREFSPITGDRLIPVGDIQGLPYARCSQTGSLFLAQLPSASEWSRLLSETTRHRASSGIHSRLAQSRTDNVYAPKLDWIQESLRLQEMVKPRLVHVGTFPSEFTPLLSESGLCSELVACDEMRWSLGLNASSGPRGPLHAAVLLESLDRVSDPAALLAGVSDLLVDGGLLFVTALVSSGFDMAVLGLHNQYLYPPDRANCFSLRGLTTFLSGAGFSLIEVSTPGVLDVEIVREHLRYDQGLSISDFERQLVESDGQVQEAFQTFLQQQGLSSFARIVARKTSEKVKK